MQITRDRTPTRQRGWVAKLLRPLSLIKYAIGGAMGGLAKLNVVDAMGAAIDFTASNHILAAAVGATVLATIAVITDSW